MSLQLVRVVSLLAVAAALIAGCSKPEDKFVGSYTGKITLTAEGQKLLQSSPMAAQMMQQATNFRMNLTLNKDKTASAAMSGAPNVPTTPNNGTWALQNDKVVVNIKLGTTPSITFTPSADGKTLTPDAASMPSANNQYGQLIFTKN